VNNSYFTHFSSDEATYFVQLLEVPVEKKKSYKVEVEVVRIADGQILQQTKGRAIVYLQKDSSASVLQPGEIIQVNSNFQPLQKPTNPGQFDYGGYLRNRGIHRTAYVRKDNWFKKGQGEADFMGPIRQLRATLLQLLNTGDLSGEEGQIASALLLGYKEDLDPELRQAFVEAGAMHVLAVSGLHVGIVFMALSFLLKWIERFPNGKVIKVFLIVGLIWFYALLTGSSPSVIRASVMFSMIGLAGVFQRQANIYNTLAASAFVMLMFDPSLLFEVGFQLSYSAVLGIVAIYPKLRGLLFSRFWLLNKMWDLTAVSIAAQLGTLPLSLYYFHQMPVYSFLSNLIVIPAAFIVISIGGIYLVFFWIKPLALVLAKILWAALWLTNSSMKWIGDLPASVIEFPNVGFLETLLLYGLIICVLVSIIHRNRSSLTVGLICSALLLCTFIMKDIEAGSQQKLIIFDQRNGMLIAQVDGMNMTVHADSIALHDPYIQRTIEDAARNFRVKEVLIEALAIVGTTEGLNIEFGNEQFSVLLPDVDPKNSWVTISRNTVVIPSAIKSWLVEKIIDDLTMLGKPNYSIGLNGALILDLNGMVQDEYSFGLTTFVQP